MSPLFTYSGRLLQIDGALVVGTGCCRDCYCFEREVNNNGDICYEYACAETIPEGDGWTQTGGPYNCNLGCCNCIVEIPTCAGYTEWKIIDTNDYLYAKGPIVFNATSQILIDLPQPFVPLFYDAPAGARSFKLQAKCGVNQAWHTIEEWEGTITLCETTTDRYPQHSWGASWTLQDPCDFVRNPVGKKLCVDGGPQPCPGLSYTIGSFDGQEWRDPDHTIAVTFTGAEDGEWTNLANWQDAAGRSPARYLPDANSSVTINAPVTSVPSDYAISVDSLTVGGNGVIYIFIFTNSLTVYGKIGCLSPCSSEAQPVRGTVVVNGSTSVFDGGVLEGFVSAQFATTIFKNSAYIGAIGWTECDDLDRYCGYLSGDAEFNTGSFNDGYIAPGNSGVVFNDNTQNRRCADGTVTFNDFSSNTSTGTVLQIGIFNDGSANDGTVGIATFNDNSFNNNIVLNTGDTTFNDSSRNSSTGKIKGNAIFNNTSSNAGDIDGNATFNDSSRNDDGNGFSTVTIGGNLLFKDTSYNITNNTYVPVVSGTTTFEDSSSNRGGMSSASFTETSYNDVGGILASGTFSGSSYNAGTVNSTTSFADNSYNNTGGTVNGDANFNDTSRNKGNVTGTAIFAWPNACNDGGTAGAFVPPDPTCP